MGPPDLESVSRDRLIDDASKQPYFLGMISIDRAHIPMELRARLRSGDVITSVDGNAVRAVRELRSLTSSKEPGTLVRISYVRDGAPKETEAEVTDRSRILGTDPNRGVLPDR